MGYLPADYVSVSDRVDKYHAEHTENMSIETSFEINSNIVIFKAIVKTKKGTFTWSSFWQVGKEKAFEKLETVAVGRALAFAGYETRGGIASREEMENFQKNEQERIRKSPPQFEAKWLNYDDLIAIIDAGNTTGEQIKEIIIEDWYKMSKRAQEAIQYYLETGDMWKDLKSMFFQKPN